MRESSSTLAARIVQEHAAIASDLPTDVLDRARRKSAIERLGATGLPTSRHENWRYANLHTLEHVRFAPAACVPPVRVTPDDLPPPIDGYTRYTFVDGRFAAELSAPLLPDGAITTGLSHPTPPAATRSDAGAVPPVSTPASATVSSDDAMALLNEAFATDSARIAATDTHRPLCIEIVFVSSPDADRGAAYPRLAVTARPNTRLGLIERHVSLTAQPHLVNGSITVEAGAGASIDHYRLQQTAVETTWMDTLNARVGVDAAYRLHLANLGGRSARSTLHVALQGERASVLLNAVSVPDRHQVHDVFATIAHIAADTKTEERFRGIAAANARVAFNGKIVVHKGAHRTVSRQSLRGLLAGAQAEVDVRPQLEIYTDDVQCSHGATAGKLDDTMLFYLLSRGLDRETAQRLLKWAFLEDVVSRIDLPELRRQIEHTLAAQMDDGGTLKEML